jgi:hypothetical protein
VVSTRESARPRGEAVESEEVHKEARAASWIMLLMRPSMSVGMSRRLASLPLKATLVRIGLKHMVMIVTVAHLRHE